MPYDQADDALYLIQTAKEYYMARGEKKKESKGKMPKDKTPKK